MPDLGIFFWVELEKTIVIIENNTLEFVLLKNWCNN